MATNHFNFQRRKTLGIEPKNEEKVFIKIPLESGKFWEREYLQNDLIGTVINDFKAENHVDIPKDYFMDWNCKNKSLKMTDKIKTLIVPQIPTIQFTSEMKKKPLEIQENEIIPDIIGKPFDKPFEIFLFTKNDKMLKIQSYDENIINNLGLNLYNSSSAYCNGNNKLFISGGETKNKEMIDKLWEIDLENNNSIDDPIIIPPKKNHSMIFIPPSYIFVVGGNDKKTFYYDTEKQEVFDWANLNIERNEPALQRIGNDLYCFDNVNKSNNKQLTFEKTVLNSKNPEWTLLYPKFDPSLSSEKLPQKFFGVSKDLDNSIIFLGGNMDYYTEGNQLMNYKYIPNSNLIEPSNVSYKDYNFKEKTFLPYNKNIDYILPDFNKQHPEVVFYVKKKSKMEKVFYKPNLDVNKNNILRGAKKSLLDSKYDFNMPSIVIPIVSSDNNENLKSKPETTKYISPYATKEIHEPSFQEYDFNSNYKIKQPPPFKEPEIEANKGDERLSIEIPNNIVETTREKENTEINLNVDIKEEEKNNEKNEKIKLRYAPKPPINYNRQFYTKIPYDNEISIPKFHYSVNDPGNELILTRKGKVYTSYVPREPVKIKSSYNDINIKSSRMDKGDLILPNYNYSVNYAMDGDYRSKSPGYIGMSNRNMKINGNMEGDILTPNIHMPQSNNIDFNTINVDSPNYKLKSNIKGVDINGPSIKGSYKPDFNLSGIILGTKSPKFNAKGPNINITNYKLNGEIPGANIKGPKINLNIPDYSLNGEIEGTGIKGPKIDLKSPDIDLKSPNINIDAPNIDGPKIELNKPNIDLKGPNIDLKGPDYKLDGSIQGINVNAPKIDLPSGNINLKGKKNKIDIPKPNIDIKGPKINGPDFQISGIIPGIKKSSSGINIKTSRNIPNYSLNADIPQVNLKSSRNHFHSPDIDIKGSRKIGDYNINGDTNMSGIIPGVNLKGSSNINLPSGNINVKGPKIDGPGYNLSGNIPGMNIKSPNLDVKGPKINGPDFNMKGDIPGMELNGPKVDVKVPDNVKGEIPALKINVPKVDIKSPNVDLKGPDYNLSGSIPGIDVNAPKIDMPSGNINLKGPNIKGSDLKVSLPETDINAPKVNLKSPKINLNAQKDFKLSGIIPGSKSYRPNYNINGPNINIKGPNINKPNMDMNIKGPDYNLNGEIPGMKTNVPNVDIKSPNMNLKGSTNLNGYIPGIRTNSPNIEIPSGRVNLRGPKVNQPEFKLSGNIPGINSNDKNYLLSGTIPSYRLNNDYNYKINASDIKYSTIEQNINIRTSRNRNLKSSFIFGDSPSKRNFHGSVNDPNYSEYFDIKGSRRPIFSSQIDNLDYSKKVKKGDLSISGNKIIDEQDVVLQDPYKINPQLILQGPRKQVPNRSVNLVVSQLAIQPEEDYTKINKPQTNIQTPKIEIEQKNINIGKDLDIKGGDVDININNKIENLGNVDIKLDNNIENNISIGNLKIGANNEDSGEININVPKVEIKNDVEINKNIPKINIEKPKLDGNLKINKKVPTNLRFKPIKEEEDNKFGVNLKVGMNNKSDQNSDSSNSNKEINPKTKNSERGNIRKKGKGLPMVGIKTNNFKSSKIDVAGRLDADNIDVNNMKSANVGINGVKTGERIIE